MPSQQSSLSLLISSSCAHNANHKPQHHPHSSNINRSSNSNKHRFFFQDVIFSKKNYFYFSILGGILVVLVLFDIAYADSSNVIPNKKNRNPNHHRDHNNNNNNNNEDGSYYNSFEQSLHSFLGKQSPQKSSSSILSSGSSSKLKTSLSSTAVAALTTNTDNLKNSVKIETGEISITHHNKVLVVPYYHCTTGTTTTKKKRRKKDVVLLHGAKYSKEEWKSSTILQQLCAQQTVPLGITALDLPVTAGFEEFFSVFQKLQSTVSLQFYKNKHPVALITPSASGNVVIDYISKFEKVYHPQNRMFSDYVDIWIPIAPVGLLTTGGSVTEEQVAQTLSSYNMVSLLAVYGEHDKKGKLVSEILDDLVHGVATVEIKNAGHACYLDQPNEFVEQVIQFLSVN